MTLFRNIHVRFVSVAALLALALMAQLACRPVYRALVKPQPSSTPESAPQAKPIEIGWNGGKPVYGSGELAASALEYLNSGNFRALEIKAEKFRSGKERFPGGAWKIDVIYEGLDTPKNGLSSTDGEWEEHLQKLKQWEEANPDSITPYVALALSYVRYGQKARGFDFAQKVSDENWRLFKQRIGLAQAELVKSENFPEKCPGWYDARLSVAHYDGVPLDEFNKIFEEAVAREPLYYYHYRSMTYYLLPQWHGNEGDWEKFAVSASDKIGGREGSAMFYFIASDMLKNAPSRQFSLDTPLWEKFKKGFADAIELYGDENNGRTSEFAELAMSKMDIAASCDQMDNIDKYPDYHWDKKFYDGYKSNCTAYVAHGRPKIEIAKAPPGTSNSY